MDLASLTNAPREIVLGDAVYRARALTLAQLGELLAWLEDRTSTPLLPLSSEPARLALASTEGLAVVLHLSLMSCQPGLTRDEALALAGQLDADGESRLMAVAFRRRPGYAPPAEGGKDLAEADWGAVWEGLTGHRADRYEAVGRLTLDQLDNFVMKGEVEGPDALSPSEVQRMWEQAHANGEGFTETADVT